MPRTFALAALLGSVLVAGSAHGQQNGNTYNGVHNQPT